MAELARKKALVKIELKFSGTKLDIDPDYDVEISIRKAVNKISRAVIRIVLKRIPDETAYTFADKNEFKPGTDIDICVGFWDGTPSSVFQGMITRHSLSRQENNRISLELECAHKALKMTTVRKNSIFETKTDSDIINSIVGNYSLSKTVDSTSIQHAEIIQFHSTDWDFALSRADASGLVVYTNDDKIEFKKLSLSAAADITVKDREGLLSFNTSIEGTHLFSTVKAQTWDPKTQAVTSSTSQAPSSGLGGNLTTSSLASTFNSDNFSLMASSVMAQNELKEWANSKRTLSELSRMQGVVTITGTASAGCGKIIELSGISERFNGKAFIGGVEHQISLSDWKTEINIGMPFESYYESAENIDNKGAGGLMPSIHGLQTGKVTGHGTDPDGHYRIEVKLTSLISESQKIWARVGHFYANNASGALFMPEVDDEVILGFIDQDPRNAIVLGSLYSSKQKPDLTFDTKNNTKGIVTRTKMKLTFDEDKKIIVVETPGGNKITMDDDGKKIEIVDSNTNKVTMNSSGIELKTTKDIKLNATGKVEIKGTGGVKINSTASVELKGMTLKAEADTAFEAKGNASAKVQSTGILTIQGSLVKIN